MHYYEGEVFTLGIWKNFEEMEESLSLSELLRLYEIVRKKEQRKYKMHLRAAGADVTVFDDGPVDADRDDSAFMRIAENVEKRAQEGKTEGTQATTQRGGSQFGPGIGFKNN